MIYMSISFTTYQTPHKVIPIQQGLKLEYKSLTEWDY